MVCLGLLLEQVGQHHALLLGQGGCAGPVQGRELPHGVLHALQQVELALQPQLKGVRRQTTRGCPTAAWWPWRVSRFTCHTGRRCNNILCPVGRGRGLSRCGLTAWSQCTGGARSIETGFQGRLEGGRLAQQRVFPEPIQAIPLFPRAIQFKGL